MGGCRGDGRRSDGKSVKVSYTVLFHWWSAVAVAKARQNTSEASPSGPSRLLFHLVACACACDRL